jgi:hypothetical protein
MSLGHSARQRLAGSATSVSDPSLTIQEFCAAEKISRSMVYKLWSEGKGPRFFNIGTVKRISHEARQQWRREREAEVA